jgi:predicted phosphatase
MKTIYLDLDLTIWECFDKHQNPIWGKQMLPPFRLTASDSLVDDVGSVCILRNGFNQFIFESSKKGNEHIYITNGGYYGLPIEYQPVEMLLLAFEIRKYFVKNNIVLYKTDKKWEVLRRISQGWSGRMFLYDDNVEILSNASEIEALTVIDSKDILDWRVEIQNI